MMHALNRKLIRDLLRLRGQAVAIALVMACGIATLIMTLSTLESLRRAQEEYYERYRFADVFARLKRAPWTLAARIRELPGVAAVQTRIVQDVTLDLPSLAEPAVGRLISIPPFRQPGLNDIFLRKGRYIDPSATGEVLVGEAFALAHGLTPGDRMSAIINGRKQRLTIVGIALSPEYVLQVREGDMLPDEKRFGVFWMNYDELAAAFDMEEAFNNVSLRLLRGASEPEVLRKLDLLIEPYGGIGAHGRHDQLSHRYLSDEMRQLRGMGMTAPTLFLAVAAFLLNVVMSRLIKTQREQIAALKSFGYSRLEIGWHFLKFVLLISLVGVLLGTMAGIYLGRSVTEMYTRFYKFPVFRFDLDPRLVALAAGVSTCAAVLGTFSAVRAAMRLPPAEAMRPEPPARYRRSWIERPWLSALLSPAARMILRNLERRPIKAAFSSLGIALAVAILILGAFMEDSLDYIIHFQFFQTHRYDMNVAFVEPLEQDVAFEVARLPGVLTAEPYRAVPTRMRMENRSRRVAIMALPPDTSLFRLLDADEREIQVPTRGIMLSTKLAELLDVGLDDMVTIEVLEGKRPVRQVAVTALVKELQGTNAYMDSVAIGRLLGEQPRVSGVFLDVDRQRRQQLYQQLKQTPRVAAVTVKEAMLRSFQQTVAENLNRMRAFNVAFAVIIACGVVYNTARISLSERSRELATLRVIGFTRAEISGILLGELACLTLVALPLGMLIGYGFAAWLASRLDTDVYRIPLVVDSHTYAFAVSVVLAATAISGWIVRRHLDHLDLVAVLKTPE